MIDNNLDYLLKLFYLLCFFCLCIYIMYILYRNKKTVQLDKIKEMLENDISLFKDELVKLYALNNVDNNEDKIKDLEFKIRYYRELAGYINFKM